MTGGDAFDDLMVGADSAMVIVTTRSDDERAGCLVGFHSQSGMDPHALSVWLSKANHTFRVAVFAEVFAVHFLTDAHMALAELFGTNSGDDVDKFSHCAWHEGPGGVPLLGDCPHRVIGRKRAVLDTTDDHVCLVLQPEQAETTGDYRPLRLSQVLHLHPGHEAEERPEPADTRAGGASGADAPGPT